MSAKAKDVKQNGSEKGKSEEMGFFSTYIIQPAVFLHILASIMVFMVIQEQILEKTCRVNLGYSEEICDAVKSKTGDGHKYLEEEQAVQKLLGNVIMWRTIFENMFPIALVLLIGSWSDKYGRKLPMLAVLLAFMLQNVLLILCEYFPSTGAWPVALVSSVIPGLSGNIACFIMAVFNYVSDTSPVDKVTVRTGITHSALICGLTIGLGLGGFLVTTSLGFIKIYALGFILESIVFLYFLLRIKNVVKDPDAIKGKTLGDMVTDLFSTQHITSAFSTVLKTRPGNTRKKLLLLLFTHFCIKAAYFGELTVLGLFGRYKFNWDGGQIGFFMTFKTVIGFIGNFIAMGLLAQTLKLSQPGIGICACISVISASLLSVVANSTFVMYLVSFVAIFGEANTIVPRTTLSEFVPSDELGKVSSFLASLDLISPLIAAPVFTMVYTNTFEFLPGGIFLLSAALMVPPILVYRWFQSLNEQESKKK